MSKKKSWIVFIIIILMIGVSLYMFNQCTQPIAFKSAKTNGESTQKKVVNTEQNTAVIGFYNVENLFDTIDAPRKNDGEYLPHGHREWNTEKYFKKLANLSKVMLGMNDWNGPDLIGLCEVENRLVLEDLLRHTPMAQFEYEIVHQESPDVRGIDVALLYKKDRFNLLGYNYYPVKIPEKHARPTREILHVWGVFLDDQVEQDTVHVFVNHWPSRMGGQEKSAGKRVFVASKLKQHADSVMHYYPQHKVVLTGDFNDSPTDYSIKNELIGDGKNYYNTSILTDQNDVEGTIKYQARWDYFDQMIISNNLLKQDNIDTQQIQWLETQIYAPDWIQEDDPRYRGKRPLRTFSGKAYLAGYSDHFPVKLVLQLD